MNLLAMANRLLPRATGHEMQYVRPLPHLGILRHPRVTQFEAGIYEPVVILILSGGKENLLGTDRYAMTAGDFMIVSHDLPVTVRITRAPYVALLVDIQLDVLRELYDAAFRSGPPSAAAIAVRKPGPALLDVLTRYVALAGSPADTPVLEPLITRELHYRLAAGPGGAMLRDLVQHDSHASAIAKAIGQLRAGFRAPVVIPKLARSVGMSTSAFHKHFKAVTASSPLQYRKGLQLLEARRLLRAGAHTVTTVAFDVGYESAAQFSRDYARKFGVSPKHDLPRAR